MSDRFDELCAGYLEGELDPDGLAELDALLAAEPDRLREAADLYQEHRLLGIASRPADGRAFADAVARTVRAGVDGSAAGGAAPPAKPRRRPWAGYAVVALASLLLSAGVQRLMTPTDTPARTTVTKPVEYFATLARAAGCRWSGPARRAGDRLGRGELALTAGRAVLLFDGGASLAVTGPARLRVDSAGGATLLAGEAAVRAPEDAAGFLLRTPASDVVDLGTEFSIKVDGGATEIHVVEGEVEWHRPGAARSAGKVLGAGQAVRFVGEEVTAIPPAPRRFSELAPQPTTAGRVLARDDFDYDFRASPSIERRADGGSGWATHWYRVSPESRWRVEFEPAIGALRLPAEPQRRRHYCEAAKRVLAEPIDLDADGVRYVAFTLTRGAAHPAGRHRWARVAFVAGADRKTRLGFGLLSDGRPIIYARGGNTAAAARAADGPCRFVGKVVCGRGRPDQVFLKVYGPGEEVDQAEPFAWTAAGRTLDLSARLTEVHINNGPHRAHTLDDLRVGTTWAAVTAPEALP